MKDFRIGLIDDFVVNTSLARTVHLVLSNAVDDATVGSDRVTVDLPASAVLVIEENDSTIQFVSPGFSISEGSANAFIGVERSGGTNETVTVDYRSQAGTATANSDYREVSGVLTFAPGITNQFITIPILEDNEVELAETVNLLLTNTAPLGVATLGSNFVSQLRIVDNEFAPGVLGFSRSNYIVFESRTAIVNQNGSSTVVRTQSFARITLNRTNGFSGVVSVGFRTSPSVITANPDIDYTQTNGVVSFADGESTKFFEIPIIDDRLLEGNEDFGVELVNPGGGELGSFNAVVTIIEDDSVGVLQLATNSVSPSARMPAASMWRYIVSADLPGSPRWISSRSQQTWARPTSQPPSRWTTYPVGQVVQFFDAQTNAIVSIPVIDDSIVETLDEAIGFNLANPTFGAVLGTVTNGLAFISDNDVEFVLQSTNFNVFENDTNAFVTIVRNGQTNITASVDLVALNGTDIPIPFTNGFITNIVTNSANVAIGTESGADHCLQHQRFCRQQWIPLCFLFESHHIYDRHAVYQCADNHPGQPAR